MSKLVLSEFKYLIGLSLEEAKKSIARKNPGIILRVIEIDGESCFPESDLRYNRINVCVSNKKIIALDGTY